MLISSIKSLITRNVKQQRKEKTNRRSRTWKQVLQMVDLLDTILTKVNTITVIVRFREMGDNLEDFS